MKLLELLSHCNPNDCIEVISLSSNLEVRKTLHSVYYLINNLTLSCLNGNVQRMAVIDDKTLRVLVIE